MNQSPMPQSSTYDDEIDLFELFASLWQEKWLIAIITAVVAALAAGYALVATPVYQTSSILKPTLSKDLDALNRIGVYSLSPGEALTRIGANLQSYEARFEFFQKNPELFESYINPEQSAEQNFERFNRDALKTLQPDAKQDESISKYIGIQLEYPKGVDGAKIVNGLIRHAINIERARLEATLEVLTDSGIEKIRQELLALRAGYATEKEAKIAKLTESDNLKKTKLLDELEALRISLKDRRSNRMQQLAEAITIAESLKIKKPTTPSSMSDSGVRVTGSVIRTEVNNQQIPLYFMGTEALQAEYKMLEKRESDDFTSGRIVEIKQALKLLENNREIEMLNSRENEDLFLPELAGLQKEITRLKNVDVDMDKLQLVRIDQAAIHPNSPSKPKKSLIVAVGVVLGGMLGVFAALVRSMIRKRRLQTA